MTLQAPENDTQKRRAFSLKNILNLGALSKKFSLLIYFFTSIFIFSIFYYSLEIEKFSWDFFFFSIIVDFLKIILFFRYLLRIL